jgi:GT2 family glycosyltransferase
MERDLTAPTTALIIETNNLAGGGGDADTVERSLTRLLARLRAQTRPLASLDEVLVVDGALASAARERLQEAAGRQLRFVTLEAGADYYAAKDAGFAATRADVVAFADADCWPEPDWLRALLAPFSEGRDVAVVAGRTSYRDDLFGAAATAVDFMYFASPLGAGCTRNFYANNVAFRRDVLAAAGFGAHGFYRGSCQVLGLALQARGVPIRFAAGAHTVHRLPDTASDLARLRLLRGADSVELAPHLAAAYLPRSARWLARLGPLSGLAVLAVRYG